MPEDFNETEKGQIPTNLRLLLLLEEVARAGSPLTPTALGEALHLPKPTIHRLLNTAESEGFLQRDIDGRSYGPGHRMRRLSINTLSSNRMRTERLRILRDLAEAVGETCNLAAPGRVGMVYIDRVETHWPLRIQLPVGTQVPFYCTASGKMYLSSLRADRLDRYLASTDLERRTDATITEAQALKAELTRTRERGYSSDEEEFMDGMTAIAVPICDDQNRLLSTLSIHSPIQRANQAALIEHLGTLKEAARRLEELVGD